MSDFYPVVGAKLRYVGSERPELSMHVPYTVAYYNMRRDGVWVYLVEVPGVLYMRSEFVAWREDDEVI